jgi:hypothetical protein
MPTKQVIDQLEHTLPTPRNAKSKRKAVSSAIGELVKDGRILKETTVSVASYDFPWDCPCQIEAPRARSGINLTLTRCLPILYGRGKH